MSYEILATERDALQECTVIEILKGGEYIHIHSNTTSNAYTQERHLRAQS